jgi:uncharacterized membrane protein
MNNHYRYIYISYMAIWLLCEGRYFHQISDFLSREESVSMSVNETLVTNFRFGAIGLILSLIILLTKKTGVYFIYTCAIGLVMAGITSHLDDLEPSSGAQSHINSATSLGIWLLLMAIICSIWLVKALVNLVAKIRDDR